MATPSSQFHLDVPSASSDAVPSRPTSPPRQHAKRPSLSRQSTSNRSHLGANYPVSLGSGHPSTSNVNVRRLPFASDESLILQLGGATRSFSMPVPEHIQQEQQEASSSADSSRNPNDIPTSPPDRPSRPPYVRGNTTITGSAGLNVMSDDEGEKKAFQPVLSKSSTDSGSMGNRVVSHSRDDRAEKVRLMVDSMRRKCSEQGDHIKSLEWHLNQELDRSRLLSSEIIQSSLRLEVPSPPLVSGPSELEPSLFPSLTKGRKRSFQDLTTVSLPSMSKKLAQANRESEAAKAKLPRVQAQLDAAETKFDIDRKKAQSLYKYFLWRMTPWWKKLFAYSTGKVKLNWSDHSLHRRQSISTALSWGAVVFAVLSVALATLWYFLRD